MKNDGIVEYPSRAVSLRDFFGEQARVIFDGRQVESSRFHVVFPTEADKTAALSKWVHIVMEDREIALKFLLDVLDEFHDVSVNKPESSCPLVGCQVIGPHDHLFSGPAKSTEVV